MRVYYGQFRRYYFCLGLSYATFAAHAARVRQRSYTTRHFHILIVVTTFRGFLKHVSKPYDIFRVVCNCREVVDDTIRVADMT